ncbi:MAG: hypothetical protein WGN25_08725 [Candidatus Electrothrix sp. GW3-4]|uniref:hypothetical protein n=1 Tax=Candidatus Electrothrix sp. GW3-4 TaxID=3126740 RepID=UPI0030CC23D8
MNIFTAAVNGFTIVIEKIGIAFKAILIGMRILFVAIIDAFLSFSKWLGRKILNAITWLFKLYLSFESGCIPIVQKAVGILIRLRWGVVILSILYAVLRYLGLTAFILSVAVCGVLILIGYSEAEHEEKQWEKVINTINEYVARYLKYVIRVLIFIFSIYMLPRTCYVSIVLIQAILNLFGYST